MCGSKLIVNQNLQLTTSQNHFLPVAQNSGLLNIKLDVWHQSCGHKIIMSYWMIDVFKRIFNKPFCISGGVHIII